MERGNLQQLQLEFVTDIPIYLNKLIKYIWYNCTNTIFMISRISHIRQNSLRPLRGRGLLGAPEKSGALGCSLVSLVVNPALDIMGDIMVVMAIIFVSLAVECALFGSRKSLKVILISENLIQTTQLTARVTPQAHSYIQVRKSRCWIVDSRAMRVLLLAPHCSYFWVISIVMFGWPAASYITRHPTLQRAVDLPKYCICYYFLYGIL